MEDASRKLLDEVLSDRLQCALSAEDEEHRSTAFRQAMEAAEKQIELDKVDTTYWQHSENLEKEKEEYLQEAEFKKDESEKNRKVQFITFTAGLVITPIVEVICKTIYANKICKLEQFETFTTSAGRGISSWFRFKH